MAKNIGRKTGRPLNRQPKPLFPVKTASKKPGNKKSKKIRIVFACPMGLHSSKTAKREFLAQLSSRSIKDYSVDNAGLISINNNVKFVDKGYLIDRNSLLGADIIILDKRGMEMINRLSEQAREKILRKKIILLDSIHEGELLDNKKFNSLLKLINKTLKNNKKSNQQRPDKESQ